MTAELFVIEGEINALCVGASFLPFFSQSQSATNAVAGVAGAMAGQHGIAANAASIDQEGADIERFACTVGEHLIEGGFTRVLFSDGDRVKAVVQKQAEGKQALFAHAVLRPSDGLLSMPYGTGRGVWAEVRKNMRWGTYCALSGYAFLGLFAYFDPPRWDPLGIIMMIAMPALLGALFALWAIVAESEGEHSTAIFRALNLPNPKSLDLKPSAICPNEGYLREFGIFRYRRVVSKEDDPHGSPEPEPLKRFDIALAERIKAEQKSR